MTCRHFNDIIKPITKPPTQKQLLQAEGTEIAKDLYAYCYCLRLRPASKFADKMLKGKRRRSGCDSSDRFCVEYGLKSGSGICRYTRGDQIVVQGVCHVICLRCGEFKEGAVRNGKNSSECLKCWVRTKAYHECIYAAARQKSCRRPGWLKHFSNGTYAWPVNLFARPW